MRNCRSDSKGTYVYSSLPVARFSKNAYRNEPRPPITLLEMDAKERLPPSTTAECDDLQNKLIRKRAMNARKFIHKVAKTGDNLGSHIGPNSVCFGRSNAQVQTGLYLEELRETVETDEFWCQTDQFLDRPPSPVFVPAKVGIDVGTQIEAWELFDFNIEVRPILEVLVGKTVEQALLEVMEEEELAELRRQQAILQEIHNADLDEIARLEERNRRYREEQARRKFQAEHAHMLRQQTADKIAARCFVKAYLEPLLPTTFGMLLQDGYFYDCVQNEIETGFFNELIEHVLDNHVRERRARILVDGIINQAVNDRYTAYREAGRELMTEKLVMRCLPVLAQRAATFTIMQMTRMTLDRMEMAIDACAVIFSNIQTELLNNLLDDAANEIYVKNEAEKRALEDELKDV